MGMNWFEGGRRISALFSGIVILCGAVYIIIGGSENRVVLETASPSDRFTWTLNECSYPDQVKEWGGKSEFKSGDARSVAACFRVNKNGNLWYGFGSEQKFSLSTEKSRETPNFITYRSFLETNTYTDVADTYMNERMSAFKFTNAEYDEVRKDQWMIAWVRFWNRVKEATLWVVGILFALWVVTTALGWIVRGFAGVPNGRDFKSESAHIANQNAPLTSMNWLSSAVPSLLILGGIAWGISAVTSAAAPQIGHIMSKLLNIVGAITALGIGVLGGYGLWLLIHKLLKRDQKPMSERMIFVMGFGNMLLVCLAAWPFLTYTVIGEWYSGIDRWSRANGYADSGSMAVLVVFLLWPFIPLLAIWKLGERASNGEVKNDLLPAQTDV